MQKGADNLSSYILVTESIKQAANVVFLYHMWFRIYATKGIIGIAIGTVLFTSTTQSTFP